MAKTGEEYSVTKYSHHCELLKQTKLQLDKVTETGRELMNKEAFAVLAKKHKAWAILEKQKILKSYLSKFKGLGDYIASDDRIHANFSACLGEHGGTSTGRLATSQPSLQNLPNKAIMKKCFKPEPGWLVGEIDLKQAEVRVMAMLSNCANLKAIFENPEVDPYKSMAVKIWGLNSVEDVTKEMRSVAKVGILAKLYRQDVSAFWDSAKQVVPITKQEAEKFYEDFNSSFPEILEFQKGLIESAREGKAVGTVFGRQRFFTYPGSEYADAEVDRQVVNYPVQSTSSDITLWGMMYLMKDRELSQWIQVVNTVHDSVWFLVREDADMEWVKNRIGSLLCFKESNQRLPMSIPLSVNLDADIKIAKDFGELVMMK
jgi:DNA polymerase I-like protein with 3'-5' exonuclease and polymerase domains